MRTYKMKRGRYVLHMYCDEENPTHAGRSFPDQYTDNDKHGAMTQAKAAGWLISRPPGSAKEIHICPTCSGAEG